MRKIKTLFDRNWEGDRKCIDRIIIDRFDLLDAVATEKLDGTNVRITVRNHIAVRAEKRRNPSAIQKVKGVIDPWYVDASEHDPQDKYIYDGIKNTDFSIIPDGEHSGELLGVNIQGNPLNLTNNHIVFFFLGQAPVFEGVPTYFEALKDWLPKQKSKYGNNCGIEGIVWHCKNGNMYKIKNKDFNL